MIKLWIDDIRQAPDNTWHIARSSNEAISFLESIDDWNDLFISFDHDLGGDDTARRVINYMIGADLDSDCVRLKDFTFSIHSANPVGAQYMRQLLETYLHFAYDRNF